jgi:CRP-like cAMP-binding protein
VWHYQSVDQEQAMTELRIAMADLKRQDERRERVADALLMATEAGIRQKDLVSATGYTREHVRRLVEAARERRDEAASGS